MEPYGASIVGLVLICLLPILLANITGPLKGKAGLIGGPVPDARDDNFLFRLDRTHGNSVESIPAFVAPAILAMMVGLGPAILPRWSGLPCVARALRRRLPARRCDGPGRSLRTLLYALSSMATILLIISVIVRAI